MKNNFCIIMAGGVGSRFWPLSRTSYPKQFIDILGTGKSLMQQTYERFKPLIPAENFLIVTNADYKDLVLEQLPDLKSEQVLLEPFMRNTAPCIAYANQKITLQNPDAKIIVTPADHLVLNVPEFHSIIKKALAFVEQKESLLTLGISPSRPDTGYGYIQKAEKETTDDLYKVKRFTEKPDLEKAKFFLKSGEFFWNSGIFLWSLKSINNAFSKYLPEINHLFEQEKNKFNTQQEAEAIQDIYTHCQNISIDYGVMEKADNVYVLESDFDWSDLGTWGSLYANSQKDDNNNAVMGENVFLNETKNCIINVPSKKIVITQGLEDYILVESKDMLLICKKEEEQRIKEFTQKAKNKLGDSIA